MKVDYGRLWVCDSDDKCCKQSWHSVLTTMSKAALKW